MKMDGTGIYVLMLNLLLFVIPKSTLMNTGLLPVDNH